MADGHEEPAVTADCRFGGDGEERAEYAPRFEERAPAGRIDMRSPERLPLPAGVAWALRARAEARTADPSPDVASGASCEGGVLWTRRLDAHRVFRALVAGPEAGARAGSMRAGRSRRRLGRGRRARGRRAVRRRGRRPLARGRRVRWGPGNSAITGVLTLSEARPGGGAAHTVEERGP